MNNRCEICGGTVMINTDTGIGTCDSCGNNTEIDRATVTKYRSLIGSADRKMMYNSMKYYTEAKGILEDIQFVDGAKEKLDICNKRITEMKITHQTEAKRQQKIDSGNSKVGVAIAVIVVIGLILLALAAGFFLFKLIKGQLSSGAIVAAVVVAAIVIAMFITTKTKRNKQR